jgi:hypothetical protein
MAHAIMIPSLVMAKDVDSLNRSFICATALDNGNVISLGAISSTAGEGEVFVAATPVAATPTGLYMVGEPEIVMSGVFKGLDPDIRNYYVPAATVATCFKIKKGDIVRLSSDAMSNAVSANTFVDVQADAKLVWAASSTASTLFKLVQAVTIPISGGAPSLTRGVAAYRLEAITE